MLVIVHGKIMFCLLTLASYSIGFLVLFVLISMLKQVHIFFLVAKYVLRDIKDLVLVNLANSKLL